MMLLCCKLSSSDKVDTSVGSLTPGVMSSNAGVVIASLSMPPMCLCSQNERLSTLHCYKEEKKTSFSEF